MAKYEYVVADLKTRTPLDEVPLTNVRWSKVLNGPGALSANIQYQHPKATRSNFEPGARALFVRRNGIVVWGGIIWTVRKEGGSPFLNIGAEGFWSYFRRRTIRHTLAFAGVDQFTIARDLVSYAQGLPLSSGAVFPQPGGDMGIDPGAGLSGRTRDRTYHSYERKNLGEAIEQLAAVQDGFDFAVEVTEPTENDFELRLQLDHPRRGRRTNFTFEVGANVELLAWELDATRAENRVDALGAGEGDGMLIATAQDTNLLAMYPLLDGVVAYKDVLVRATLTGHAVERLAALGRPLAVPKLVVRATPDSDIGAFIEGDEVLVRADDGFVKINGFYRIESFEVQVSEEGHESIGTTFIETEAFA